MTQITDGKNTLEITTTATEMVVNLKPNQYKKMAPTFIESLLTADNLLLAGTIQTYDESLLQLKFELPINGESLVVASKVMHYSERLQLAIMLSLLENWQRSNVNLFLAPQNIFVVDGQLKLAHRGFEKLLVPADSQPDDFLQRYKALVVSVINPKYQYETLIEGANAVNDHFERSLISASSIAQMTKLIQDRYRRLTTDLIPVNKKRFTFFKWGFVVLAVGAVILGGSVGYLSGVKAPAQSRIINSQAAFMTKDYNKATTLLKDDRPEKLTKAAQYVLADSYINLDNLTTKQKKAILNNISPQSDTNTLLYWIYSGKGNFDEALSLAKNIGDDQLILYAYTKLYDVTKADNQMAGNKKQDLLNRYQTSINKYVKKLGGKADGVEK